MARSARIVTVNLGSQTISLAEFHREGTAGLILHGYRARDVISENPTDPLRHSQITNALGEMLAELGIKSAKVNYAVPSQSVFTRFVKLPAVEEEKIERIIAFEAQQNDPFSRAEARKKESKFVSLIGTTGDAPAADIDPISKTIVSTMTRLHAEIMRSISHYRSQQAGNAPSQIFLCGGTSSTPHVRDF